MRLSNFKILSIVSLIFTLFSVNIYAGESADEVSIRAEKCRQDFEKHLSAKINEFNVMWLLDYKVEIIKKDLERAELGVLARTLEDAYLVRHKPESPDSPEKYITPEVSDLLKKEPFILVARIICAYSFESESASANLNYDNVINGIVTDIYWFWVIRRETSLLSAFIDKFFKYFDNDFHKFALSLQERKKYFQHRIYFHERYTDSGSFNLLQIYVDVNARVWDGRGISHSSVQQKLEDEMKIPGKFERFSTRIFDVNPKRVENVFLEIESMAQETSKKVLAYIEEKIRGESDMLPATNE